MVKILKEEKIWGKIWFVKSLEHIKVVIGHNE